MVILQCSYTPTGIITKVSYRATIGSIIECARVCHSCHITKIIKRVYPATTFIGKCAHILRIASNSIITNRSDGAAITINNIPHRVIIKNKIYASIIFINDTCGDIAVIDNPTCEDCPVCDSAYCPTPLISNPPSHIAFIS